MHSTEMPDRSNMAAKLKNLLLLRSEEVFISSWPMHKLFLGHSDDLCPLSHFSEMTLMLPGFGKRSFCAHRFLTTALTTAVASKAGTRMGGFLEQPCKYFIISMAPASVKRSFRFPQSWFYQALTRVFLDGTLGSPQGYCGGPSAHRRGQKGFHTLSPDRATLNVSSVSAGPLAIYSH